MSDNQPLSQLAASLMEADVSPSPSPAKFQMKSDLYARPSPVNADLHDHMHDHIHDHKHHNKEEHCGYGWWSFIFYFLVFALVLYFVFFALRPSFVLNGEDCSDSFSNSYGKDDREINNGKLLCSAIVGSLIIIFVFWIFSWILNNVY